MSVTQCTEINRRLRAAGITVHEVPGWPTRGNGYTSAYEGGLVHHTASGYGKALPGAGIYGVLVNGRSDLKGPLCNYAGNDDGSLTVIAANPANHAGASGGRSMGPLPVTKLFNPRVLGLEIVYPGTSPMRDAQYRSALVWARVVADVVGRKDIERVRAHAETSITGKWDPGDAPGRTINMVAFRKAATITIPEDDMSWDEKLRDGNWTPGGDGTARHALAYIHQISRRNANLATSLSALTAAVAADKDIDPAQLARMVDESVARHTPTVEQTAAALLPLVEGIAEQVLGTDNKALASEFIRQLRDALPEGN